jgi:hypothetical protein
LRYWKSSVYGGIRWMVLAVGDCENGAFGKWAVKIGGFVLGFIGGLW